MSLFLINFDLRKNKKDYKSLFEELKYIGALQLTKETWCIKRTCTHATTLRNHLLQLIFEDDSLIVSKIQEIAPYKTKNLPKDLTN